MMKIRNWLLVILLVSLLLAAGQTITPVDAAGTIRHVVPGGLSSGTCLTWAKACNLQRALSVVAVPGDQIWVKQGTYKPTSTSNRGISFTLKKGVGIYGGFAGTETQLNQRNWLTHVTTLSGNIGNTALATDNSNHVVVDAGVNKTAMLDGFTITAGNATSGGTDDDGGGIFISGSPTLTRLKLVGNSALQDGGGIYVVAGKPILTNVTFTSNHATLGGGMFNYSGGPTLLNSSFNFNSATSGGGGLANGAGGSSVVTNVTFSHNTATTTSGGGIYDDGSNPTLTNVVISSNSATYGGGIYNSGSSPKLTNVTFNSNSASDSGGGIGNYTSSSPTLKNVTFTSNKATVYGGGMYDYNSSSPTLTNVTFNLNTATNSGGGMLDDTSSSPTLMDVTFAHNSATDYSGGGLLNYSNSSPTLTNVTFASNSANSGGGGMLNEINSSPTIINVTFYGNSDSAGGGALYDETNSNPSIVDSIFWNNSSEVYNDALGPTITDSVIADGCPALSTCQNFITANPILGPLANNGGFTKTMALGVGSSAIDAGGTNSTCASKDQRGIKRPQGLACDIGAYEAPVTVRFNSYGSMDGWVLESGAGTNIGGLVNVSDPTLRLGDDPANKQYRSILSFNTSILPDTAVIQSVSLNLKYSSVTPASTNPISLLHGMMVDVKKGFFGTSQSLQAGDFQASAGKVLGPFSPVRAGGYYTVNLGSTAVPFINKSTASGGLTQIRLRFKLPTNSNGAANVLSLGSGNGATDATWPGLIIVYTTP